MARLYMVLAALQILLVILALISCLSAEESELRVLPRIVWVIIILLFPLVGSIVYFAAGRPVTTGPNRSTWRPGSGFPESERPRPVAPDDNPEFLRSIERERRQEQEDLLKKWEADLRRREENLRDKDEKPPADS